jgi:hypothetical protein
MAAKPVRQAFDQIFLQTRYIRPYPFMDRIIVLKEHIMDSTSKVSGPSGNTGMTQTPQRSGRISCLTPSSNTSLPRAQTASAPPQQGAESPMEQLTPIHGRGTRRTEDPQPHGGRGSSQAASSEIPLIREQAASASTSHCQQLTLTYSLKKKLENDLLLHAKKTFKDYATKEPFDIFFRTTFEQVDKRMDLLHDIPQKVLSTKFGFIECCILRSVKYTYGSEEGKDPKSSEHLGINITQGDIYRCARKWFEETNISDQKILSEAKDSHNSMPSVGKLLKKIKSEFELDISLCYAWRDISDDDCSNAGPYNFFEFDPKDKNPVCVAFAALPGEAYRHLTVPLHPVYDRRIDRSKFKPEFAIPETELHERYAGKRRYPTSFDAFQELHDQGYDWDGIGETDETQFLSSLVQAVNVKYLKGSLTGEQKKRNR